MAALEISPGLQGVVGTLLTEKDSKVVALAIRHLWDKESGQVADTLEPLLLSDNEDIRTMALSYLAKQRSRAQLRRLIQKYLKNETYYYNVVTWLDRVLYAPQLLRTMFLDKLESRLVQGAER